ncbi:MAG: hypothetical protein Q7S27_07175 [Nanoarchaeota archaeon]|nr:hypothetical protein [Nanoarchaeota archaeon]
MVHKDILEYIREGISRGFSIELLKSKLLEEGFSEADIDKAIHSYHFGEHRDSFSTKGGKKWMEISGVIGIIMIAFNIFYLMSIFIPSIRQGVGVIFRNNYGIYIFFLIMLIISTVYYVGLIKLGRKTNSKMISFYAWGMLILFIAFIVLILASATLIYGFGENFVSEKIAGSQGLPRDTDSQFNRAGFYTLIGIYISFVAFYLTIQILFSIGLIKIRKIVKFSNIAGILNLTQLVLSIGIIISFILFLYFKPLFIMEVVSYYLFTGKFNQILIVFLCLIAGISIIKLLSQLFTSLALFDASKKFE